MEWYEQSNGNGGTKCFIKHPFLSFSSAVELNFGEDRMNLDEDEDGSIFDGCIDASETGIKESKDENFVGFDGDGDVKFVIVSTAPKRHGDGFVLRALEENDKDELRLNGVEFLNGESISSLSDGSL